MVYKMGAHRHGWVLTLNDAEVKLVTTAGYKLETNGFYSKGDYFEVRDPAGNVIKKIDDVYARFTQITGTVSNANWMERYYEKIKNKKIWDIAIPGTHDSGIFSDHYTIGARTQTYDIKKQLHDGIRMLDLRVCCRNGQYYFIHHNTYATDKLFFDAIDQIKAFLDANKKEILLINIRTDGEDKVNGLDSDKKIHIHSEIKKKLDTYLMPPKAANATGSYGTISEMIKANHRAIVVSEFPDESQSDEFKHHFWTANNNLLYSTYCSYQGASGKTIEEKCKTLENSLEGIMNGRTTYAGFYKVDFDLWSINIKNSAEYFQHPVAQRLFAKKYENSDKCIYIIDFYELSDFVDKVIKLNG